MTTPAENLGHEAAREILAIVRDSREFVVSQAPDIAQQIIHREIVEYVFGVAIFYALGIVLARASIKCGANWKTALDKQEDATNIAALAVLLTFLALVCTLIGISNTINLIEIFIAPKVFLLEYLTKIVK